jgi:putative membrane protein
MAGIPGLLPHRGRSLRAVGPVASRSWPTNGEGSIVERISHGILGDRGGSEGVAVGEGRGERRTAEDARLREVLAWERTRLANERTFLAYVRTALAFAAGGSFLQLFHLPGTESAGWAAIGLGVVVLFWGSARALRMRRRLVALRPQGVDSPGERDYDAL